MSIATISSFDGFQKELERRITSDKEGKIEVPNSTYYNLQFLRFVIVGGNGAFNALYGWSLGYNVVSSILLAAIMFSGDWALSLLHQLTPSPKNSFYYASASTKLGLVILSLFAGTSFMMSLKHAQDIKRSDIAVIEQNITVLNAKYEETSNTRARIAREREQEKLRREKERVGDFSSANAFAAYLAKTFQWEYEQVTIVLNFTWIAVLLSTGMSLSAQLSLVWYPKRATKIGQELTQSLREQTALENSFADALDKRQHALQALAPLRHSEGPRISREGKSSKVHSRTKRPTYEKVRNLVITGQVKPRQRALTSLGMGALEASNYLRRMLSEGVLMKPGRDYMLAEH